MELKGLLSDFEFNIEGLLSDWGGDFLEHP